MKIVGAEAISELLSRAAAAPRKRMNLNLHAEQTDVVGRFLNAGIACSYVRPHRHQIDRWELVTVLQGRFDVVIFTLDGMVKSRIVLNSQGQVWRKFQAASGTVLSSTRQRQCPGGKTWSICAAP
jgi:cupin fold WbuC family metalloprotein